MQMMRHPQRPSPQTGVIPGVEFPFRSRTMRKLQLPLFAAFSYGLDRGIPGGG
jgi:hypothetical protein